MKPRTPLLGPADGRSSPRRARRALVAAAAATALLITPASRRRPPPPRRARPAAAPSRSSTPASTPTAPAPRRRPAGRTYSPDGTASASYTEWTADGPQRRLLPAHPLVHGRLQRRHVPEADRDTERVLHARRVDQVQRRRQIRLHRAHRLRRRQRSHRGSRRLRRQLGADRHVGPRHRAAVHDQPRHRAATRATGPTSTGVTFTPGTASLPISGGDVSTLYRGEQDGGVYYTASGTAENALDQQLADAGMNYVRLRVWVNPATAEQRGAAARDGQARPSAIDQKLLLDFHYTRHLGRPRPPERRPPPGRSDTLHAAARRTCTTTPSRSSPPWSRRAPRRDGAGRQRDQRGHALADGSTSQLGAARRAAQGGHRRRARRLPARQDRAAPGRRVRPESGARLVVLARPSRYGVPFDIIGLSYYDYWHGRLDVLQSDLDGLAAQFGKPVMVAETAYPFTLASNDPTDVAVVLRPRLARPRLPGDPGGAGGQLPRRPVGRPGGAERPGPRRLLLGADLDGRQGQRLGPDRPDLGRRLGEPGAVGLLQHGAARHRGLRRP